MSTLCASFTICCIWQAARVVLTLIYSTALSVTRLMAGHFFSAIHHVKHQDLFAKELLIANKAQMVFTRENKNIGCFHCK